jgi:hypothetical protein
MWPPSQKDLLMLLYVFARSLTLENNNNWLQIPHPELQLWLCILVYLWRVCVDTFVHISPYMYVGVYTHARACVLVSYACLTRARARVCVYVCVCVCVKDTGYCFSTVLLKTRVERSCWLVRRCRRFDELQCLYRVAWRWSLRSSGPSVTTVNTS